MAPQSKFTCLTLIRLCHNPYKATGNIMSEFRTLVPTERVILNAVGLKE